MPTTTAPTAFLSCITSKMLSVAAVTNTRCPQLIYSTKDRHSLLRSSKADLKADTVSKQATRTLHMKARLWDGGSGGGDVPRSRSSAFLPRRLSVGAVSDQDEALPQSVDIPAVKVKFVLQRECLFGQKFSIVGEDTALGAWDPHKAFCLEWSSDHTWTGELAFPVGKKYEFKFVLMNEEGVVEWQPGPNCAFETLENTPLVVVSKPWVLEELDEVVHTPLDSAEVLDTHGENHASNANAEMGAVQEILNEKPHLFYSGNDVGVAAPRDMVVAFADGKIKKPDLLI